ncbi:hypothetical protein [Cupriavidus plantarum]|uniref:hypothetical protein n=1 Tax=Cupriavidus plantarum TaxID=942865 RepID=UPI000F116448|nr:hypothetical protein [Cupriavidus plantarum]RLK31728.1 hypothetical protein C7417_4706 [Cupriavidus plantarum]
MADDLVPMGADARESTPPQDAGKVFVLPANPVHNARDVSDVLGWGADLDPKDRPGYPRERTPPRVKGPPLDELVPQPRRIVVHHSVERPGITPIFGTSAPPTGISGALRHAAFQLSENDVRHWLLLMFADRVNVVEGIAGDLSTGHIPNIFAEMGWAAEWKYNRPRFLMKIAVAGAVVGVAYLFRRRSRHR